MMNRDWFRKSSWSHDDQEISIDAWPVRERRIDHNISLSKERRCWSREPSTITSDAGTRLLDRGFYLDVAWIRVLYFESRIVELVLRSHKVVDGLRTRMNFRCLATATSIS